MHKIMYGVALAATAFSLQTPAQDGPPSTCHYREEAATAAEVDEPRVSLIAVTPEEGAEVNASTVLEVDVEYHIDGFEPDKFFLLARFPALTLGTRGVDEGSTKHFLRTASGRVRMCVPLKSLYQRGGVRWPLTFKISLNEQMSASQSMVKADSREVKLNSIDVPADAMAAQNSTPPEDVQRAVLHVFSFVEHQGALHKVCPAHFPELAAPFVKAYRNWESRNAAAIGQVHELQYELYLSLMSDKAAAAKAFDATRNAVVGRYRGLGEPALRAACEAAMSALAGKSSDIEVAAAESNGVMQKYLAARKESEGTN